MSTGSITLSGKGCHSPAAAASGTLESSFTKGGQDNPKKMAKMAGLKRWLSRDQEKWKSDKRKELLLNIYIDIFIYMLTTIHYR